LTRRQKTMPQVVAVSGDREQTPAELALRVQRRIEQIDAKGAHVGMAVILAGAETPSDDLFQARCLMARTFLTHLTARGRGDLVFGCSAAIGSSAGLELMSLVGTLTSQLDSSRISVGIRFESETEGLARPRIEMSGAVA